jgi:exodeoxyribonuclease V alpha subunit
MFATPPILPRLTDSGLFTPADLYQARFTADLYPARAQDTIAALTALLSLAVREGHVCLDLDHPHIRARLAELGLNPLMPDLTTLIGPSGPLVAVGRRLYFARFYRDEAFLARAVRTLIREEGGPHPLPPDLLGPGLDQDGRTDWQTVAVFAALRSRFCVISGGPGTGKTRTVARILKLAAQVANGPLSIGLAAPTGKAASRMAQSLTKVFGGEMPPDLTRCVRGQAQTVHRLLGWQPGGAFRYHRGNPLPLDMLVVDEVSMLDLEMTARLMDALPPHIRLVLLGDRHQLASVEAGAVLANLCQAAEVNRFSDGFVQSWQQATGTSLPRADMDFPLTDHVVELQKSWRFGPDSGIARLASLIRDGLADEAVEFLGRPHPDLEIIAEEGASALSRTITPLVRTVFAPLGKTTEPTQALHQFDGLRLLSPIRQGPRGTVTLNRLVREILTGVTGESPVWYPGRPVMILENDYALGLFNGDVGIALPENERLRVFFAGADGVRSFAPSRLPRHETCYAMTVHKSQGSEFDHAVLILPEEPCPILGRELLYTALTRARKRFTLFGDPELVRHATLTPVRRDSGLGTMLATKNAM